MLLLEPPGAPPVLHVGAGAARAGLGRALLEEGAEAAAVLQRVRGRVNLMLHPVISAAHHPCASLVRPAITIRR
jgi:hypothetical protein